MLGDGSRLAQTRDPRTAGLLEVLRAHAARPLDDAVALPPALFADAGIAALERERIFARDWHCVGRTDDFDAPGKYLALEIAGEPVAVLGDDAGGIRAFANVCRHRSARLLGGDGGGGDGGDGDGGGRAGVTGPIQCPYHGWTYDLGGRLQAAPFMEKGFLQGEGKGAGICLPEFRVEVWQGWVYVNLDTGAAPLAPRLEGLDAFLGNYRMADYRAIHRADAVWETNWKILVENFTEPVHFPLAHRESVSRALPPRLTTHDDETGDGYTFFRQYRAPGVPYEYEGEAEVDNPDLTEDERAMIPIVNVFPAHLFSVSAERLFWVTMQPEGTARIRVRWGLDAFPGTIKAGAAGERRIADLITAFERINNEDKGIVEDIRRNAVSAHATPGPLSPKERCLWEFHRYLARMLADR